MIPSVGRVLALAVLLAGCGSPAPSPSASADQTAEVTLLAPGRPFDGETIRTAMRDSRRPGGVPDQLQTDAIAGAVADAIWTVDGEPWTAMAIGGSCGVDECALEVAGSRTNARGEDAWAFSVIPATEEVTVVSFQVASVPDALVERADELAREADDSDVLDGLILASHSWQPPPADELLVLAYRAGDEEGSCRRAVRVDVRSGDVEIGDGVDC